jgi:hypothetical protein
MNPYALSKVYFFLLFLSTVIGMLYFKRLDTASRFISVLLALTLIAEVVAYYSAVHYHNSMTVYQLFNPVQFLIVSLYFNSTIPYFKKNNLGIYIGVVGVLIAFLNCYYLQPINTSNSYFLILESISIVFMSLFSFSKKFVSDNVDLLKDQHFWFTFFLLTFWSITNIYWGMRHIIQSTNARFDNIITLILIILSIITYTAFGIILFLTSKKRLQVEQ